MDFWNTIRGNRLADTLIHCLPQLTKKPQQYTKKCKTHAEVADFIEQEIESGNRFVSLIERDAQSDILIIMERGE